MTDDIVTQLRDWEHIITYSENRARVVVLSGEVFSQAADEIERLRAELKDADDDFHALKAMFDKMRADRDRWRKIAEQLFLWLHPSPEDDSVYEAGVEAMTMYEQAVRGE